MCSISEASSCTAQQIWWKLMKHYSGWTSQNVWILKLTTPPEPICECFGKSDSKSRCFGCWQFLFTQSPGLLWYWRKSLNLLITSSGLVLRSAFFQWFYDSKKKWCGVCDEKNPTCSVDISYSHSNNVFVYIPNIFTCAHRHKHIHSQCMHTHLIYINTSLHTDTQTWWTMNTHTLLWPAELMFACVCVCECVCVCAWTIALADRAWHDGEKWQNTHLWFPWTECEFACHHPLHSSGMARRGKRESERASEVKEETEKNSVERKRRWERKETISGNFSVLLLYSTTHPQVIVLPLLQKSCYNNPHSECSHWNTPKVTLTQRDNHIFNSCKPALPHPSSPIVFSQHHPTVLLTSSKERQK